MSSGELVPSTIFFPSFISPSTYGIFDFDEGSGMMSEARWSVKESGASGESGFSVLANGFASTNSGGRFDISGGRISSFNSSPPRVSVSYSANRSGAAK